MKALNLLLYLIIVTILTLLTQVGGLVWIFSFGISKWFSWKKRYIFPLLYLIFNLIIIPPVALLFGRTQLPIINKNLAPRNWFYPLTFRNYVRPELKTILLNASKLSDIKITYLDANFPFINEFPLLPHLSHNDGKKVDLSFMYLDKNGNPTDKKPSLSGYGIYANSENLASTYCINKGYWQYDFPKYLTFGTINNLNLDSKETKKLITVLASYPKTQKLFIEPYLKKQLGLQNESKIRFHGCQAVRHDDHIHLQVK